MKQYKILIDKRAKENINHIYNHIYYKFQQPETAKRQKRRILEKIRSLEMMPERIKIMESEPEHTLEIRRLLVDNYSVFFFIEKDNVVVIRVLYSPSNFEEKLLN